MKKLLFQDKLPNFLSDEKIEKASLFLIVIQVIIAVAGFFINVYIGTVLLICVTAFIFLMYYYLTFITKKTNDYITDLSYRIKKGEQEALIKMPIGILLFDEDFTVQWANPYFQAHIGYQEEVLGKTLEEIDEELNQLIKKNHETGQDTVTWENKTYRTVIQDDIRAVYLMDITEYDQIKIKYKNERIVVGNIFIDNYDEIVQSMSDRNVSKMSSFVTTQLSNWAKQEKLYLKRIADDRYVVLMHWDTLEKMEKENFNILDQIREKTSKQNLPLTLSIGLAYKDNTEENENLSDLANLAQSNMDLALGRGGDQVVVKSLSGDPRYYGGKTNPMEKRTRVRSRVISQALQELIKHTDKVFIMGHKNPDMDAIGSSLGVRRIAEMNEKEAWVIVKPGEYSSDVTKLIEEIDSSSPLSRYIIDPQVAEEMMTPNSLLIIVDFHRPSMAIAPELMEKKYQTVVIDHHRRGEEFPENPALVYIEPYASSTAELITELFEYQPSDAEPINKMEATAMLGGIIVDTKSFSLRTGSRTFDAASYLRSRGADTVMIQRLLKEDRKTYLERSHLIGNMEFVTEHIAVSAGEEDKLYGTVVTAQTADTLLSMTNVDAAFVITKRKENLVGISARSLGEINVQVIMEKLGGGGHLSNAATQLEDTSIAEAKQKLENVIHELYPTKEE